MSMRVSVCACVTLGFLLIYFAPCSFTGFDGECFE